MGNSLVTVFYIKAMGVREVETKFERMGLAAINAEDAMATIGWYLMQIEKQMFNSQGRRGGGSWMSDSPEWLARKSEAGLDPRINHATLALRESVTELDAPGQVLEISPNSLIFGSDLPYAAVSQRNRPFVRLLPLDREQIRNIVRDHLINAWRAA
jgi:hypothetical protein